MVTTRLTPITRPGGGEPLEQREHFMECYDCGRWIDMRNVDDVITHERSCGGALAPARPKM